MVRELIRDAGFLSRKSKPATAADKAIGQDLVDTLQANMDRFFGMSANMIGERKRIIVICNGPFFVTMLNPKITGKVRKYKTDEACPLLEESCTLERYETVTVAWQDTEMQTRITILEGFQAQVVQHLIDHLDGKLV